MSKGRHDKAPAQPPEVLKHQRFLVVVDSLTKILSTAIRYLGISIPIFGVYLVVKELAGRQTMANINVNLLGSMTISEFTGYGVGGAGLAYGLSQRKLRRSTNEKDRKQIAELQRFVDPNRSSSRQLGREPKDDA